MTPYVLLAIIAVCEVIGALVNIRYWINDRADRERYGDN